MVFHPKRNQEGGEEAAADHEDDEKQHKQILHIYYKVNVMERCDGISLFERCAFMCPASTHNIVDSCVLIVVKGYGLACYNIAKYNEKNFLFQQKKIVRGQIKPFSKRIFNWVCFLIRFVCVSSQANCLYCER